MRWRKHKTNTQLINTLSNLLGAETKISASGFEKISRTTAAANRAIAVFCHSPTRGSDNKTRGGRHIK